MKEKISATIFSVLVVSLMIFVTIGTATVMFASAQQSTNATGSAEHTEGESGGTTVRDSAKIRIISVSTWGKRAES